MDKPIRVLHVIGIMNRGGAETMIMNLYRHIDRSKVQFDFVENSSEPAIFDEEIISLGGRIYRCPHYNGKNHFTYVKWWNEFFQAHSKEYPIVHGHLGNMGYIPSRIATIQMRIGHCNKLPMLFIPFQRDLSQTTFLPVQQRPRATALGERFQRIINCARC